MNDERNDMVYEEYAFDEMFQQEEAVFFWSVNDSLEAVEMFGIKPWFTSFYQSLSQEQQFEIAAIIARQSEEYKYN